jgi:hypothetical protein
MIALSPVMACKVQSLVFGEDDEAVYFVMEDGVFGVWHHKEFHRRVYGGVLLVLNGPIAQRLASCTASSLEL